MGFHCSSSFKDSESPESNHYEMSSNALTTFTRFNDFPAEIRHMIWAEAIHPGGVENNPLEIYLRQSNDRTRPGTKPSDLLQVVFPSTWPPCHPRCIVPRACKEAWAVNLLLHPHCVKVYINSQHRDPDPPVPPRALRFHGARDRLIVFPEAPRAPDSKPKTVTVISSDVFKDTREIIFGATSTINFYDDGCNIARLLPFSPSLRRVVWGVPRTEIVHMNLNQLVPLAQAIKAGWHDWRVFLLGQTGAAPELVQNGDRFVRRCTVACRHCGWKHEEHEDGQEQDGQEQDVFDLMEEERRQLEAQGNTEQEASTGWNNALSG
ncbi:hypothetical protein QBC37DRAFT_481902 [Rhypophila decipiens]|uniref:2EXR domain-containing protein n=1 Tax=Rhypophila decipiens TaxID=261697 RepID=A0AAN7B9G3_9PEZI|nr:hypothetical protein QBC37DRAFT_481902 [Rhypophila decipiens]